jgi:hypothetical protein
MSTSTPAIEHYYCLLVECFSPHWLAAHEGRLIEFLAHSMCSLNVPRTSAEKIWDNLTKIENGKQQNRERQE